MKKVGRSNRMVPRISMPWKVFYYIRAGNYRSIKITAHSIYGLKKKARMFSRI
ncbi:hypothetical protein RchiOBHm_Chr7g0210501 [Rosa chinensis]|uniref:Uncharacterized protein n=1 Tax=Rosa chinensis TaxID=74649 RepID=A0A2P6PA78_ROSCH|nr:hypothetical protein RchiOBHm_Chr7g0210501 [Rosa chinensis]